jgi:CRISPR/Cas system endoribonuclease Cas6 (RAMP superfamily)
MPYYNEEKLWSDMLSIVARTATSRLKIKRSMARLFQSFVYAVIDPFEHEGYRHGSGKIFKATNFSIRYFDNRFEIYFVALNEVYEQQVALRVLQEGLKLGEVHFTDTTVSIVKRHTDEDRMVVQGFVCAAIKNRVTGRKIFLEPGEERHNQIVVKHSLQKYETLFEAPYNDELQINVIKQKYDENMFFYDKTPYKAWLATYEIKATPKMLNLLLDTGLGGDSMKNLGFLELV